MSSLKHLAEERDSPNSRYQIPSTAPLTEELLQYSESEQVLAILLHTGLYMNY